MRGQGGQREAEEEEPGGLTCRAGAPSPQENSFSLCGPGHSNSPPFPPFSPICDEW